MTNSRRLDQVLVERGAFPSRARAQGAIRAGLVSVAGVIVDKPSASVADDADIAVKGDVHDYVSRGALKLEAALRTFKVNPAGATCLDLGASTGGFTEVLLRGGAAKVYAVDVGTGQLHPRVAEDPRVVNLQKTHAKDLSRVAVPEPVDIVVCDVSFTGLKKVLPYAMALTAPKANLIALIKPQFEVGRSRLGKGGIVKPGYDNTHGVADDIAAWINGQSDWKSLGYIESPITGGDGNKEFLIGAIRPT